MRAQGAPGHANAPTGLSFSFSILPPVSLAADAHAFVASADAVQQWAVGAAAGERCVYARAVTLPHGADGPARARTLAARGVLTLNLARHAPGSELFDYLAKRTTVPFEAPAPDAEEALPWQERLLLEHLSRRADQGAPCDSNRALARAVGLRDGDQASYRLKRLRDRGLILLAAVPVEPGRVVTIVETGRRTGLIRRARTGEAA